MPLPPLPHQGEGSDFLAGKERGGLFDEPGVGKTAQAMNMPAFHKKLPSST